MINLKKCPLCGFRDLKKVTKDLKKKTSDHCYCVPNVTYYYCQKCNEGFLLPESCDKIESYRTKKRPKHVA